MRIRHIEHCNFRKSEQTIFEELVAEGKLPKLSKGDVVVLMSSNENQLVFLHGFDRLDEGEHAYRVLPSQRFRLSGGRWTAARLAAYANEAGISLSGVKRLDWHLKEINQARHERNRLLAKQRQSEATEKKKAA